jgi:hypothetical protein
VLDLKRAGDLIWIEPRRGKPLHINPHNPFGDIAGKLRMLQIECTRCARRKRYSVAKLIAQHGHSGNMSKRVSDVRGDCPNRNAPQLLETYAIT